MIPYLWRTIKISLYPFGVVGIVVLYLFVMICISIVEIPVYIITGKSIWKRLNL